MDKLLNQEVFVTFNASFSPFKTSYTPKWKISLPFHMLISYTSEIPTLLYTWSLKKVPLSGGAFPKKAIIGSSPPPGISPYLIFNH